MEISYPMLSSPLFSSTAPTAIRSTLTCAFAISPISVGERMPKHVTEDVLMRCSSHFEACSLTTLCLN